MAKGGGQKDGRTDGRTDGRMDGLKDGRTTKNSPLCPTGHRPFGAAAQKGYIEARIGPFLVRRERFSNILNHCIHASLRILNHVGQNFD